MLTLIAYCAVAAILGIAVLGQIFVLQAIFTSADHADGRHGVRTQRSFLPDLPV